MNSKVYIGNIQPNPKEFKIWVNDEGVIRTFDGNKWNKVEGGSSNEGGGSGDTPSTPTPELPAFIGFEVYQPSMFGDGYTYRYACDSVYEGLDFGSMINNAYTIAYHPEFSTTEDGSVWVDGCQLYREMSQEGWSYVFSDPVKTTDAVESRIYYIDGGGGIGGGVA